MELRIPAEIYSRVVGYFRPVEQWNHGKKAEFEDRKFYDMKNFKEEQANGNKN